MYPQPRRIHFLVTVMEQEEGIVTCDSYIPWFLPFIFHHTDLHRRRGLISGMLTLQTASESYIQGSCVHTWGGVGGPIPLTYSHIIHATQSMHNTPTPPLVGPVVAVLIPHSTPTP